MQSPSGGEHPASLLEEEPALGWEKVKSEAEINPGESQLSPRHLGGPMPSMDDISLPSGFFYIQPKVFTQIKTIFHPFCIANRCQKARHTPHLT